MVTPASDLSALTERLATSSTGWGAVIDGVLDIRTVSDTARAVAVNAFAVSGVFAITPCDDPACDCLVKALEHMRPNIKIIPVKVEAVS